MTAVGLTAAAMLMTHGFHLHWSQTARMYSAGGMLSILATYLLLRLAYDPKAGRGVAIGYVATMVAGTGTVELFWPLIGMHILWAFLMLPADRAFRSADLLKGRFGGTHQIVQLQAVALILSAPELLHGVYRARRGAASDPSLEWLMEYLSFGFLFHDGNAGADSLRLGLAYGFLLLIFAVALLVFAARVGPSGPPLVDRRGQVPLWFAWGLAVTASAFMVWLASIAFHRNMPLMVVATGPLLALTLPSLSVAFRSVASQMPAFEAWSRRTNGQVLLIWMLALVAPLIIFVASSVMSLLAQRAFLVLVPYLLLLLAAPVALLQRSAAAKSAIIVALLIPFGLSIPYSWRMPGSPRDYKALAAGMSPMMQPDDLVFVRNRDWTDTPLFYYLPDARYVFSDYARALRDDPAARVWLVTWPSAYEPVVTDERRESLAAYSAERSVTALRASAELFLPPAP